MYTPDTERPFSEQTPIRGDKILKQLIDELGRKNPPVSIGFDHPLIVVTPDPKKQLSGDPGYLFNDSIYILYSKPDENEIAVIATARLLRPQRQLHSPPDTPSRARTKKLQNTAH